MYVRDFRGLSLSNASYVVAMISKLLKIIGLFCKRALQKRPVMCMCVTLGVCLGLTQVMTCLNPKHVMCLCVTLGVVIVLWGGYD